MRNLWKRYSLEKKVGRGGIAPRAPPCSAVPVFGTLTRRISRADWDAKFIVLRESGNTSIECKMPLYITKISFLCNRFDIKKLKKRPEQRKDFVSFKMRYDGTLSSSFSDCRILLWKLNNWEAGHETYQQLRNEAVPVNSENFMTNTFLTVWEVSCFINVFRNRNFRI